MKLTVLTHVDFEGPAGIGDWAEHGGHELEVLRLHRGDELPEPECVDMLAIMGGPMSVHDRAGHPWLEPECKFLAQAMQAGVPMLGVCLGAQLLAQVLGAGVVANAEQEIGFHPVAMSAKARALDLFNEWPPVFEALHWHGETFGVPAGAVPVGSSEATASQGFVYQGRVVGLQFHIEATPASWDALIKSCGHEVRPGPYVQTCREMQSCYERIKYFPALLDPLLDSLAELVS